MPDWHPEEVIQRLGGGFFFFGSAGLFLAGFGAGFGAGFA